MEESLRASSEVRRSNGWPSMTEQDMDAAQQLIQLSEDSSSTYDSADLLDDHSTSIKRRRVKQEAYDYNNSSNNSRTSYVSDDVSCRLVMMKNMNVKKRKFRTVEELYRATRPVSMFENHQKRFRN